MKKQQENLQPLDDSQLMRYSRHIMLPKIDIEGQEHIWNSKVLIIGVGGLGCAVAQYLVASGVGTITLIDDDDVDRTNLQRQVLHKEMSVGTKKVHSAKNSLKEINSEVDIICFDLRLDDDEMETIIKESHIVLDCSDNLETRNQLNRLCFRHKTPLISGAAIRMEGQVSTFTMQPGTPCYQCLSYMFDEQVLTCSEAGVLSPVVGLVGSIQAAECLKLITKIGETITGKLLMIDAATMQFSPFKIKPHSACPVCSSNT
ncbi:MAG: molybdopterin-synthase adenylyltransferase MoeB [Psychrobium sp.]